MGGELDNARKKTFFYRKSSPSQAQTQIFDSDFFVDNFPNSQDWPISLQSSGPNVTLASAWAEEIGVRIVAGVHIAFSGMRHSSAAAAVRGGVAAKWSEKGR